jgi:fructoselysine 6-kinase
MKIVSIGEITIDRYLLQNLTFVGGISLNFAVHAKRCGVDHVSLVSCMGNRPKDRHVLNILEREGIDTSHVLIVDGDSAECDIEVHDNASRFFPDGGYRLNVLGQLQLTDPTIEFINQHDVLMTMYDGHHDRSLSNQLLQRAAPNVKLAMDFGDWSDGRKMAGAIETLERLDLAFFSGDEQTLADFQPVAANTSCQIIVTMGAAGSGALTANGIVYQPALPVPKAVDSTGCGDAFQAAFTAGYFQNGDIPAALREGAANGATVLQHFAAFEQEGWQNPRE